MSILIKGMEMPKSCYDCVLNHSFFRDMNCANLEGMSGFVGALPHTDDRHPDCPLILVSPHSKLIDADAAKTMTDIELVIKIPKDTYKDIIKNGFIYDEDNEEVAHVIKNGKPLSKGHGTLKDVDKIISDGISKGFCN